RRRAGTARSRRVRRLPDVTGASVFRAVLIANRGEISVRITRTLRALGIRSIAVYSDADRDARHVRACEAAGLVFVGPPARAIETMGDKIRAKETVEASGVPVVPGVSGAGL